MTLQPVVALQDQPQFVSAFAAVVAGSAGKVCAVCGLERMGHAPQSEWLGFESHDWDGVPASEDDLRRAHKLSYESYRKRDSGRD